MYQTWLKTLAFPTGSVYVVDGNAKKLLAPVFKKNVPSEELKVVAHAKFVCPPATPIFVVVADKFVVVPDTVVVVADKLVVVPVIAAVPAVRVSVPVLAVVPPVATILDVVIDASLVLVQKLNPSLVLVPANFMDTVGA